MIQASYTWSKLITNVNAAAGGSGIAAPGNVLSGSSGSNDPVDLRQQYGLAAFNRPQRLVIAYSYDLPYKNRSGFTGHVFGGWSVSGITTIQDGEPFSIIDGNGGKIYWGAGGTAFCTRRMGFLFSRGAVVFATISGPIPGTLTQSAKARRILRGVCGG